MIWTADRNEEQGALMARSTSKREYYASARLFVGGLPGADKY